MSDIGPTTIILDNTYTLPMRQTSSGSFRTPADPETTLSVWGSLQINYTSCTTGRATLFGNDGSTVIMDNVNLLVGVLGMPGC
jgi:hypothetical protein